MASASTSQRLVQRTRSLWLRSSTPILPLHRTLSATSALRMASRGSFPSNPSSIGVRYASSSSRKGNDDDADKEDGWSRHRSQYNYDPFTLHPEPKHYSYPLVNADQLAAFSSSASSATASSKLKISKGPGGRPREVRMLARDFIHDSLYNPEYGYFTKQAVLLPDPSPSADATSQGGEYREVGGKMYTEEMGLLRPVEPGFDFNSIKNESEFMRMVEERYQLFEEQISILVQDHQNTIDAAKQEKKFQDDSLAQERQERLAKRRALSSSSAEDKDGKSKVAEYSAAGLEAAQLRGRAMQREGVSESDVQSMAAKQVWHTPTQIFQPYYAHALARYLVAEYKLHNYPYDDLVIYECGAGSGTLAKGILDYLAEVEPEIYTRTRYRIVEISPRLAEEQKRKLSRHAQGETGRVQVINKDVLCWDGGVVQEPCFVIALEVFDNLAHDVVRFSTEDLTPYQAVVSIDDTGDMHELFEPLSDPLIKRYFSIIGPSLGPLNSSPLRFLPDKFRKVLAKHAPLFPNLTEPIFVPTNALRLVEKLKTHFPQHRLIMSDFDTLPDSLSGTNAPVVQTRYKATMIPVTTYMVLQGYFDIFFPTNFQHLKKIYKSIIHNSPSPSTEDAFFSPNLIPTFPTRGARESNLKIYSHAEFLQRYAEIEKLHLKDKSNPLLSWYANAAWFLS
ncbi:uncharacterized protein UTRI_00482_B [Ustilago trichophora]|uniref:type II protein arginine methyltransferase n=1 Tax=Ustilago trichophora TaxID=86804 RepID=A0A5C3DRM9_9BASI|nr:uncharacterized protein UTRI_00482_B [Ustilago trichophora]